MEFVTNIKKSDFEEFVLKTKNTHFMRSYHWGDITKYKNYKPHYVGLKDKQTIVAVALLLEKELPLGYSYFYCPRGYSLDFKNEKLLKIFTEKLKEYGKTKKAIYIKIDPDIKRHDLDPNGNIIGKENNYKIIKNLINLGYKHKGYNIEFTNEQPRFTFRLDLTKTNEEINANMQSTTRNILNRGNQYNFEVLKNEQVKIEDFYQTMEETAKRENLGCNGIGYYKNFYTLLNEEKMGDIYAIKLNIKNLKETYQKNIEEKRKKIEEQKTNKNANPKKLENRIKEIEIEIEKINKDLNEIETINKEEIILSSIITAKYDDKVWIVHGGNATLLRNLNANYFLYNEIIKESKKEGYKTIDLFGCSGEANPEKTSAIYGLHNFKKRFGGEYIEFIGEFDLIINKFMYFIFNIIVPIRRKIVKKQLRKENK
ncbi:MAG: peptidoglycan bridge formation glycyltransferase FemA/FemB family protein [Bacilli bacterium]